MSLTYTEKKCIARWYPLKPIPTQIALVKDNVRFKTVPAGRRSGKTERVKRLISKAAMRHPGGMYFIAAPTRAQVKQIYWDDIKLLNLMSSTIKPSSETELTITLDNQATISLIGLDKPERIEGPPWDGGAVDEIANTKEGAWEENIKPALDTFNPLRPDYQAWCILLGVPEGLNHYYRMCQYAIESGDPEWKNYHWNSSEVLSPGAIEAAKRQMSPRQFRQEYEASFETAEGRVYPDFDRHLNNTHEKVSPDDKALHIGMDFNVGKMSATVHVIRDGLPYAVDEFMGYRDTPAISRAIKAKYPKKIIVIYPDATGDAKSTRNASESDLTILKEHGFKIQANKANPRVKNRVNSLNAMICNSVGNRRYKINEEMCPLSVEALEQQVYDKNGAPDKTSDKDHPCDEIGYFINFRYPVKKHTRKSSPLDL